MSVSAGPDVFPETRSVPEGAGVWARATPPSRAVAANASPAGAASTRARVENFRCRKSSLIPSS
jgi:hypothetical protein